jgi:hypothetical protein
MRAQYATRAGIYERQVITNQTGVSTATPTDATYAPWIFVGDLESINIHVRGITSGDVVRVFGHGLPGANKPSDALPSQGAQLGGDITVDEQMVSIVDPAVKWLRVVKTAAVGGGSTNAYVVGQIR